MSERVGRPAAGAPLASARHPRLHPPAHAPRVPFALLVVGLIIGGMCLLLVLNTASAANELSRHDLAAHDAQVAAQVQQVRNQVAASAAPGNLANAAIAMGMVPAGNPAFLRVGENGSVTLLGSPGQASAPPAAAPPTPTPTKTPTPTHTPSPKPSTSVTASGKGTRAAATTPRAAPTKPAPTPTPTVSLPGGPR